VALLLLVVLRWSEPEAGGIRAPTTSPINLIYFSLDLGSFILDSPLYDHRVGGDAEGPPDEVVVVQSTEQRPGAVLPRAQHTVTEFVTAIFGQDGGPSSSSMVEALLINCWSSTLLEGQVVRPRLLSGNKGFDLVARVEHSSMLRSELGGNALSSPVLGGRGTIVLDCFFYFSFRVLFVKWGASSSNVRFFYGK
jgi:hypothetical protein